jgi:hypothetical protein
MEWQFQKMRNLLSGEDPWQALSIEFPTLQSIISEFVRRRQYDIETLREKIILLYRNYCAEWSGFSARHNFIKHRQHAA